MPSSSHKRMPTEIRSRLKHLVATAQKRNWAAHVCVPHLLPQILRDPAAVAPGYRLGGCRDAHTAAQIQGSWATQNTLAAHSSSVVCRWSGALPLRDLLIGSSADISETLHWEHNTKLPRQDSDHRFSLNCLSKIALTLNSFTVLNKIIIFK